ncbi:CUB and sushi domain-containing protein 1 [Trichonephila clavipes]|nr:CUB and sushi domain-containing protein 1 [Trichonephila clavipes]
MTTTTRNDRGHPNRTTRAESASSFGKDRLLNVRKIAEKCIIPASEIMSPNRIWYILQASLILFLSARCVISESQCGGYITNSKGYIHTPNFPKPYKVPIHCQWIFEAPQGSKVSVYFTQFYMKRGLTAADYTYYSRHIKAGVGKYDFGIITSNDEPTYFVSNQQILVLTMNVKSLDNIHLRVREHLLEVSGFNITYEMILRNETVRQDSCIYHHCSFTGNCFAIADFSSYICKCFANYFGEECQYDNTCGPNSTSSVCLNGGTCRYYVGSSVRTCECLPGYTGAKCESLISALRNETFNGSELECQEQYYQSPQGYFSVYPKRNNCHDEESMLILRLEISEAIPVNEGIPLLIACVIQNRGEVNITWLKDGFPIMFEASQGRLWTMQVPKDSSGRSSFLLGIDKINKHDIGTFTCVANEGAKSENLSATVNIKHISKIMINPLAATVVKGSSVSITCVSIDGIYRASSYSWLKNNADINRRRDPEKVEYLYPGGTRLILKNAQVSMNYTCIMRTQTGLLRLTSAITVINGSETKLPVRLISTANERKLVQGHETTPLRVKGDIEDVYRELNNGVKHCTA